jgi:DMSO/TMAO reductase YedYZ molybdopterin-dependent catalytic subunit
MNMIDRRRFLMASALALGAGRLAVTAAEPPLTGAGFPGLIVRQKEPANLEFPFPTLDRFITPTEQFYVRNHFAQPKIEVTQWKLGVEGAVDTPLSLTLDDIKKLPNSTVTATLECAGNGRIYLTPRVAGVPWELGAVGNAEWTGVPLSAVLDKAGVSTKAVEVILEGADTGEVKDPPATPGVINYTRSLPLDKARKPEVLLAFKMNGAELTPAHGYPLRAVVPGWYGMASVKWLTRLIITETPYLGYYQSLDYTWWQRLRGQPSLLPITEMNVKSQIARPMLNEVVPTGKEYRVYGAAWAGEADIVKVEFSDNTGLSWKEAKLLEKAVPFAWRLWEYRWTAPARAGRVTLLSRATDSRKRSQPTTHDADRRTYQIHHVLPIEVEVR